MFFRQNRLLLLTLIAGLQTTIFTLLSYPESTPEDITLDHLTNLEVKLHYLDLVHTATKKQALQVFNYISQNNPKNISIKLPLRVTLLLQQISNMDASRGVNSNVFLNLPSSLQFLPHLSESDSSLKLGYLMSKGRSGVTVVMGIPTVKRHYQYLIKTLEKLTEKLSSLEANNSLIVVFVAEVDLEFVVETAKKIELTFPEEVRSGLIEVIAPSSTYYPKLENLKSTLGDSLQRVKWRSKQNLDYAYLMAYCQTKGAYYLQLEDDVLPAEHYMTYITNFIKKNIASRTSWFVLEFCQLGFIGKLLKSSDLSLVVQFLHMFYTEKPADWILEHLVFIKGCNWDIKSTCRRGKVPSLINHRSLFQHVGVQSSLSLKTQSLKDPMFSDTNFYSHLNPEATVSTTIKTYLNYTLEKAYAGKSIFWGIYPKAGDQIVFNFSEPVFLKGFKFISGGDESPLDKLFKTTVEVLPVEKYGFFKKSGYVVLGFFNVFGLAFRNMEDDGVKVSALRLFVHGDSQRWVILSEICIVV